MCRPPDVPASGFGRRFMPGFKSRRPRGARRLSVRRADRPHGWYRVQAHAGNVVSDKRSAAASPWRKADDTGSVVLTPIGRFAVMAELQFEIVLEIIRRCTCSESTARLFLGLHRQSAGSRAIGMPLQLLWWKPRLQPTPPLSQRRPSATAISREYAISTRQFSDRDCRPQPGSFLADLAGQR